MIKLSNGHELEYVVASGALGFDGKGYFWEWPFCWLGLLRPQEFTVITKTLTLHERKGNFRWYAPWRAVKILKEGVINSVGLTNPGIEYWTKSIAPKLKYKTIASICPFTVGESKVMAMYLNAVDNIVGVEINLSCPSVECSQSQELVHEFVNISKHPVIVKLGHNAIDFIREYAKYKGKQIQAFDLINSVPWKVVYPEKKSPMHPCSGVSGIPICEMSRKVLGRAVILTEIPIISGGGIETPNEVLARKLMGARAVSFGTLFLRRPWRPNRIVTKCKKLMKK